MIVLKLLLFDEALIISIAFGICYLLIFLLGVLIPLVSVLCVVNLFENVEDVYNKLLWFKIIFILGFIFLIIWSCAEQTRNVIFQISYNLIVFFAFIYGLIMTIIINAILALPEDNYKRLRNGRRRRRRRRRRNQDRIQELT